MPADSTFRDPKDIGVFARNSVMALNNVTIANTQNAALWLEDGSDVRARDMTFDQTQSGNPWVFVQSPADTLYVDDPAALTSAQIYLTSRGNVNNTPSALANDIIFPRAIDPAFVRMQQVRHRAQPQRICREWVLRVHMCLQTCYAPTVPSRVSIRWHLETLVRTRISWR